ncbi:TlpA family protein disulfide reductase [Cellvibrio sp. QJXJ]|jgi:peroxiredoxin|uniref:TlpA family protein disulfide reductase n=1 Tax=Cellvibrio sp. QJXJ TaxID=2964606 RepID=UPI0021C42375|nr:TlpA disulfide reductase family protein [Cellvibrio sp. QJXJ]UUA72036.1 TlpA family protein disulfide reductase [Cellvibrio sp. QJXJ]
MLLYKSLHKSLRKKLATITAGIALGLSSLLALAEPAPDFTLPSSSGENVRLAEQRGQVVMLNFWASWCGPCRQEMPLLDEMSKRYSSAGFVLYGVNVEEDNTDAKKLIQQLGVTFPILYDAESKASSLYNVDAMPTTVLIDKKGEIRYVNRGYKPGDENKYRDQIRELIKE